ncbi:MAG: twin-arginine translocation signal domain-containing protein, partial [Rubrivivax sp.]
MTSRTAETRPQGFSRRSVLKAGAATTVLGAPGLLLAQPAAVKVGLVHPVSGGLAYSGGQGRLGCQMAID